MQEGLKRVLEAPPLGVVWISAPAAAMVCCIMRSLRVPGGNGGWPSGITDAAHVLCLALPAWLLLSSLEEPSCHFTPRSRATRCTACVHAGPQVAAACRMQAPPAGVWPPWQPCEQHRDLQPGGAASHQEAGWLAGGQLSSHPGQPCLQRLHSHAARPTAALDHV